jgi:hypothetical protein
MKVIITEQQYNNAIDNYITFKLEPHEDRKAKKYSDSIFWVKNDQIVAQVFSSWKNRGGVFYVWSPIWTQVGTMFSLEHNELRNVFKEWYRIHYGVDFVSQPQFFSDVKLK